MFTRLSARRAFAAALLLASPIALPAQTLGAGLPGGTVSSTAIGRDTFGATFVSPFASVAQLFQPLVTQSNTSSYLQSFTVYVQAYDEATPPPTFSAAIWSTKSTPSFAFDTQIRSASGIGPTGSSDPSTWKAITFNFPNLQLTKNSIYAFVLGITGSAPDPAVNFLALDNTSSNGDALGSNDPFSSVGKNTIWTRVDESGPALAFSATFTATTVPEPSTVILLGLGLAVLYFAMRRRTA